MAESRKNHSMYVVIQILIINKNDMSTQIIQKIENKKRKFELRIGNKHAGIYLIIKLKYFTGDLCKSNSVISLSL